MRLSAASSNTITVNYTTQPGTALADSDYVPASGSLSFAPGQTLKTVRVNFVGDSVAELNEAFYLNINTPVNTTILDNRGMATIKNDDGPAISIADPPVVFEGHSGTTPQTFTVTLSAPSNDTVEVNWITVNVTAGTADYEADSGTLSFAPGVTSQSITVQVKGDTTPEANETYLVRLSNRKYAVFADSEATAKIKNDDGPSLAIANAVGVFEGNSGSTPQTFIVTLSAPSSDTVTVVWTTANGTAGSADYVAASGTLTFNPGQTSKTITVQVRGDTTVEPNETYLVRLSNAKFAVLSDGEATATIKNDDVAASASEAISLSRSAASPSGSQTATVSNGDIGAVGVAGSASFAKGIYTVKGSGQDIWRQADGFHFVYQPLTGDGTIMARVRSIEITNKRAKAGLMMRETLESNAKHALVNVMPRLGLEFLRRRQTGALTRFTDGGSGTTPIWLRLQRRGNTFTVAKSSDGSHWITIGSDTISMTATIYVGLAVCSRDNRVLNTAAFDSVVVSSP